MDQSAIPGKLTTPQTRANEINLISDIRRFGALLALTAFLTLVGTPAAASTGKIAGTVIDAASATPVPAANIIVVGSRLGATTDEDGYFFILNLPPGTYTLQATHIGFAPYTLKDVYVSADLTTMVELQPTPASIQMKGVVVPAARPLVDKNATNAVRIHHWVDWVRKSRDGVIVEPVRRVNPDHRYPSDNCFDDGDRSAA